MEICLIQCQICQALLAESMLFRCPLNIHWGGGGRAVCQAPFNGCYQLTCIHLGCSVWTSPVPYGGKIGWVILVRLSIPALCKGACCSPSPGQCWWALINSTPLQSHTGANLKWSFSPLSTSTTTTTSSSGLCHIHSWGMWHCHAAAEVHHAGLSHDCLWL